MAIPKTTGPLYRSVDRREQRQRQRGSTKTCAYVHCEETFDGGNPKRIYCSNQCRLKARKQRHTRKRRMEGKVPGAVRHWVRQNAGKETMREGPTFEVDQVLPGSFEGGKRR